MIFNQSRQNDDYLSPVFSHDSGCGIVLQFQKITSKKWFTPQQALSPFFIWATEDLGVNQK